MIEDINRFTGWIFAVMWLFFSSALTFHLIAFFEFDEKDDSQLLKAFALFLVIFSFFTFLPSLSKRLIGYARAAWAYLMDMYYDRQMGKFKIEVIRRLKQQIEDKQSAVKDGAPDNKIKEFYLPRWAANSLFAVIGSHIAEAVTVDFDGSGTVQYTFHKLTTYVTCKFGATVVDMDVKMIGLKVRVSFREPVERKIQLTILGEIIKNYVEPEDNFY